MTMKRTPHTKTANKRTAQRIVSALLGMTLSLGILPLGALPAAADSYAHAIFYINRNTVQSGKFVSILLENYSTSAPELTDALVTYKMSNFTVGGTASLGLAPIPQNGRTRTAKIVAPLADKNNTVLAYAAIADADKDVAIRAEVAKSGTIMWRTLSTADVLSATATTRRRTL